jgi:hypothetical protein
MVGLKRFKDRQGLIISAVAHLGLLAVGLLYLHASVHNAVPPDATLVELVTPQEIPRFSGTPSALRNSGTETQARPQPPVRPQKAQPQPEQQQQQEQKERKEQRDAEHDTPPQTKAPPLRQSEAGEVATPPENPPLDPPAPGTTQTLDAPTTAEQRAQQALLGGQLGGGFNAPPVDSPVVGYDFTEPFRQVVSACAPPVPSVNPREQISVRIRVFLNRDGTLAKAPVLREANPSVKQEAMMQSFVAGLEKCQPYTMMPQEKYAQWRVIDLVVFPINSFGG